LLWLHPSLETWDNLQADFFDFYGQALNKLAFDDVVTLIHQHQVNFTMASTPFLNDLSNTVAEQHDKVDSLKIFLCAGA
ncbi:hypothetical protein DBB30_33390, partial [Yersinia pestis]